MLHLQHIREIIQIVKKQIAKDTLKHDLEIKIKLNNLLQIVDILRIIDCF